MALVPGFHPLTGSLPHIVLVEGDTELLWPWVAQCEITFFLSIRFPSLSFFLFSVRPFAHCIQKNPSVLSAGLIAR
jgi:hypothetical protein